MLTFFALAFVVGTGWLVAYILSARFRAIRDRQRELTLFGGYVKLILWEPNEGLVLLKNKQLSEIIETGEGGTKFIFPIRGDEVRARFPLTLRMVTWEDHNILTRESIQVRMKVAAWWRATSLKNFVFTIDSGIHTEKLHQDAGLLEAAEQWLKTITESTLRTLVSHSSIALLVSSRATGYLHVASETLHQAGDAAARSHSETATGISIALQADLNNKLSDYGIAIQRVEIQEITFSKEIQGAIDRVWKAALLPAQTEQEARARQIALEAEVKVLGADAVALAEIMKNFQGGSFFGMPAALDSMMSRIGDRSTGRSQIPGSNLRHNVLVEKSEEQV